MSDLRLAYCGNGLADHRLPDALALLADAGCTGVALTLDHHHLDPYGDDVPARVAEVRRLLDQRGLAVVVETGGRFVLDRARKHWPTLLSPPGQRERRLDLLRRGAWIAAELGAEALHLWSGVAAVDVDEQVAWERLVDGVGEVLATTQVPLAFEPEPGHLVARVDDVLRLVAALEHHPMLGVTLDLGHVVCNEDAPVADVVARVAHLLRHVQVDDMRRDVHEHLPFGDGELDLPAALAALERAGYGGLVAVELARHSHTAHTMVPEALAALRAALPRSVDA